MKTNIIFDRISLIFSNNEKCFRQKFRDFMFNNFFFNRAI